MEDQPHGDHVGLRQGVGEEVTTHRTYALAKSGGFNRSPGDRLDDRQIEAGAAHVGMVAGDDDRQLTGCAANVAESFVPGEVELVR